jgi:hypothetical protein
MLAFQVPPPPPRPFGLGSVSVRQFSFNNSHSFVSFTCSLEIDGCNTKNIAVDLSYFLLNSRMNILVLGSFHGMMWHWFHMFFFTTVGVNLHGDKT